MKTRSSSFKDKYETWNIISNGKQATPRIYSEKSAISDLKKNLTNPKSPISFSGIEKIYKHYNRIISKENIKNILSSYDYYTLHTKSFRKKITLHL